MKKIITVLAVAVIGMTVNAASVTWSIANVKTPNEATLDPTTGIMSSSTTAASGYVALLYLTAQSSDFGGTVVNRDTIIADIAAGNISSAYIANTALNSNGGLVSVATGYNGSDFTSGDSLTAFTVIFNVTDIADIDEATAFMVTDNKTVSLTSSTGAKPFAFGNQSAATWQAVPEPTSGLLMLVGLAGLALRRKRA